MRNWILTGLIMAFSVSNAQAALSLGGAAGADFPLAHTDTTDVGVSADGFYRIDPYEVRFHFANTKVHSYSVVVGVKNFFMNTVSNDIARPFVEAALGPVIVSTSGRGLSYGVKPEVSLGVDIGVNTFLSTGLAMRYYGLIYFGNTPSGAFEANHGFSLMGNLIVWF